MRRCRRDRGASALRWSDVDLTRACGLIIGSEARGVSEELRSAALDVSIPTVGVESLNAAVAAGILLYEARRQRARKHVSLFDTTPPRAGSTSRRQASAGRAHAAGDAGGLRRAGAHPGPGQAAAARRSSAMS